MGISVILIGLEWRFIIHIYLVSYGKKKKIKKMTKKETEDVLQEANNKTYVESYSKLGINDRENNIYILANKKKKLEWC
jgi:hypothetical protein